MNDFPLVSIVIPVYNGANYVAEAIESALAQTYPFIEVVVVDDGSTDQGATRAVAERFGSRIRYIWKPNGGVATALNLGIEQMRGELFSWLSHDDIYKPEKVSSQVETWRSFGNSCIVVGNFELMDEHRNVFYSRDISGRNLVARPLDAVFNGLINGCALLIPRELFQTVGVFEVGLPTTQDYHLWYRMARVVPFVHCPHADVQQRTHALQGSREAAHVDEASRMFVALVHATPLSERRAYDGSELRFLLQLLQSLGTYPGLQAFLSRRVEDLLRKVRYTAVVMGDDLQIIGAAGERLRQSAAPPVDVLPFHLPQEDSDNGLRASANGTNCEAVVFLSASCPNPDAAIRAAIRQFVQHDADIVCPSNAHSLSLPLNGLLVRRSILNSLQLDKVQPDLSAWEPDWDQLSQQYTVISYPGPHLAGLLSPEAVLEAFAGQTRVEYNDSLSNRGVAGALATSLNRELPTILLISHTLGGGSHKLLQSLIRSLKGKVNCLCVYGAPGSFHLSLGADNSQMGLAFRVPEQLTFLVRILQQLKVCRADVHQTMGFDAEAQQLLQRLGVPFDVTLVDYHYFARNPHLCREDGRFVGDQYLLEDGFSMWREEPLPIVRKAERVIAICRDLAARTNTFSPGLPLVPAELWRDAQVRVRHVFERQIASGELLRILVVGTMLPHKGRGVVLEAARIVARRNLPIRFYLLGDIGMSISTREDTQHVLTLYGPFSSAGFSALVCEIDPHLAWLPSLVPETWSFVLSELMEAALPIAATALGSIPERCYGRPFTWLHPWDGDAASWVDLFLTLHATGLREPPRWTSISHLPPAEPFYSSEYLRPLPSVGQAE